MKINSSERTTHSDVMARIWPDKHPTAHGSAIDGRLCVHDVNFSLDTGTERPGGDNRVDKYWLVSSDGWARVARGAISGRWKTADLWVSLTYTLMNIVQGPRVGFGVSVARVTEVLQSQGAAGWGWGAGWRALEQCCEHTVLFIRCWRLRFTSMVYKRGKIVKLHVKKVLSLLFAGVPTTYRRHAVCKFA